MLIGLTVSSRIFIARWKATQHLGILCWSELISSRSSCLPGIELESFLPLAKDWRGVQPHILSMAYFEPAPVISFFQLTVLQHLFEVANCWWWGTWLPNSTINYFPEHEWPYQFTPCCAIIWHNHKTSQISVFLDDICSLTPYIHDLYLPKMTANLLFADATTQSIYLLTQVTKLQPWLKPAKNELFSALKPYIFVTIFLYYFKVQ